jgi:tRNA threonylcarbamoyladenosine biosynthesis protein TsaE
MDRVINDQVLSYSAAETFAMGAAFGKQLPPNSVVFFYGDLGAGKTTFIKGVVSGAADIADSEVTSPTFAYLNIYRGAKTVYHFDLYRLRDADEFLAMGFDEMFDAGGICCIEWAEKIAALDIAEVLCVRLTHVEEGVRRIEINQSKESDA